MAGSGPAQQRSLRSLPVFLQPSAGGCLLGPVSDIQYSTGKVIYRSCRPTLTADPPPLVRNLYRSPGHPPAARLTPHQLSSSCSSDTLLLLLSALPSGNLVGDLRAQEPVPGNSEAPCPERCYVPPDNAPRGTRNFPGHQRTPPPHSHTAPPSPPQEHMMSLCSPPCLITSTLCPAPSAPSLECLCLHSPHTGGLQCGPHSFRHLPSGPLLPSLGRAANSP